MSNSYKINEKGTSTPSTGLSCILAPEGGTKLNLGKIASQPGYKGGADQVLLPKAYPESWIKSVTDLKTGKIYSVEEFKAAFPDQIKKK